MRQAAGGKTRHYASDLSMTSRESRVADRLHRAESGYPVIQEWGSAVHAMGMRRPRFASPGREEEMEFPANPAGASIVRDFCSSFTWSGARLLGTEP